MKNKIIVTAQMKGGAGKSTLCCLLASYLTKEGIPVAVLDADLQQSIMHHRQRELSKRPDATIPWQLNSLLMTSEKEMIAAVERIKTVPGCIIVDCPGNVQDPTLKYIYNAADIAIVPFHYDCDSIDATNTFLNVFRMVSKAKVMLLPNRVPKFEEETAYDRQWREEASALLTDGDIILPRIKNGKAVPKYSTLKGLNEYQFGAVKYAFEPVLNEIKEGEIGDE